ncbi:TRAP transporter large permease subunit [Piscinibacter sakaiensis]|uniref:TRAP-type C4-dicarboxylate transport system, large permease component n=1 Tax=Piscinibacter sakaiensis TaxID=1547922 RepID=A0A0K8P1T3_PISS1|nr:TRAP transporter large permease subunit [Piscinibacter sakaiensis]GAP36499.1 TRAP-type C4-dicarboxylate transport system, large permease component [Piscinibacter sakaiensis]
MKVRKELWFGFGLMGLIIAGAAALVIGTPEMTNGHYGLLMLSLVVVAIMLGFPTAFTLMGMGIIFTFFAYHSGGQSAAGAVTQTLDLMVQRAFSVMSNDVLISIPLFVFMGYLVERANLIEKLFRSLHLALARVPGSLAVATLFTCAVFATATGIVGAVVTLMGLLAFPQMLKSGYDVRLSAGAITAGGCLGILIPPSVMLIVYGATAGVSVVQLYAGAFFPGLMLAGLYVVYVILMAKLKPNLAPPLSAEGRFVPLPAPTQRIADAGSNRALPALLAALKGSRNVDVPTGYILKQLGIVLLPALLFALVAFESWDASTQPGEPVPVAAPSGGGVGLPPGAEGGVREPAGSGLQEPPGASGLKEPPGASGGFSEPPGASGVKEPPGAGGLSEPPAASGGLSEPPGAAGVKEPPGAAGGLGLPPGASDLKEPPGASGGLSEPPGAAGVKEPPSASPAAAGTPAAAATARQPASTGFWIGFGVGLAALVGFYAMLSFQRLEIFKMLLASFFPLLVLILAVLGSIVFGLATPTEAAAVGALGGALLAMAYKQFNMRVLKESVFLTAKTSAMVCWLFVGSAIFSAAFALLGGQELVERWVMSMNLTKTEFLILSQVIIFLLGWPLEWTEIIVIFMPIFIPLLDNFGVDPLFFGLLVALNLQTAFLSPPVAMAAFYLKGVSPPHVTLNQIFAGMLPFMGIQIIAIVLLYIFPEIGLWLPSVLYR